MKRSDAYLQAKERIEARRGFFVHLSVFVVVNAGLLVMNLATSPDYLWFKWPLMGWTIGIMFHGLGVFVFSDRFAVTDEMIERELEKERQPS